MRLMARMAWRNLWRNPRRTIISLSAVAFATMVVIFMMAMQQGGYNAMIGSAIGVYTGELQVQHAGYHDKPRLEATIPRASDLAARIAKVPDVRAVSVRAEAAALVSSEERTFGAVVVGVEPDREPAVSSIPGTVRAGRYLSAGDTSAAVVGYALARNLSVGVGDELTVLGQGRDGSLAALVCRVVGVFSSGSPDLDRGTVEVPLATLQDAFTLGDQAHSIVVRTNTLDEAPAVAASIRSVVGNQPGLAVLPWDELLEGLKQGIAIDAAVGWFLYTVLVLIVVFSILNTFIMSVLERTREFGVLLALGTRPRFLGTVVATESMFLLMAGLAVGMALGMVVTAYAAVHGIAFATSEELLAQWNLPARIYPRLDLFTAAAGPLAILAATSLAALFPILRIRRLRPVDAMKAV
jgi:putative ABC transport system permease protein